MTGKTTDSTFKADVIDSATPVVVDFWAEWCGPCRMIAPALDELSKEFEGKVKIVKLNVDENPGVAGQLGIRSIPTLMVFKNVQVAAQKVGALQVAAVGQQPGPGDGVFFMAAIIPVACRFRPPPRRRDRASPSQAHAAQRRAARRQCARAHRLRSMPSRLSTRSCVQAP